MNPLMLLAIAAVAACSRHMDVPVDADPVDVDADARPPAEDAAVDPFNIAWWGDSLTFGKYFPDIAPPTVLSILTRDTIYNGGFSGYTSTQIFSREREDSDHAGWPIIIWVGRNNYATPDAVRADIAGMIAFSGQPYLVMGVVNGDFPAEYAGQPAYQTILSLNASLADLYGERFVDIRAHLVSLYDPNDPQDVIDHAHDIPPASLRIGSDQLHYGIAGEIAVGEYVAQYAPMLKGSRP